MTGFNSLSKIVESTIETQDLVTTAGVYAPEHSHVSHSLGYKHIFTYTWTTYSNKNDVPSKSKHWESECKSKPSTHVRSTFPCHGSISPHVAEQPTFHAKPNFSIHVPSYVPINVRTTFATHADHVWTTLPTHDWSAQSREFQCNLTRTNGSNSEAS